MGSVANPKQPPVVLIVEDEPLLRLYATDIAESLGFEVVEAQDALEASRILAARNDISVVFTDVNLPGSMDGLALAAMVRDRWPPIELIVTSGVVRAEAARLPDRGVFIAKPYSIDHLENALRSFRG